MEITPYLNFNGNCAEAFRFYEKCLGGKIEMMQTHGDSPMKDQVPPELHDKVIHVRLLVGNQALMGSDAPAEHYEKAQGTYVSISLKAFDDAKRIFSELAAHGDVKMPFDKTFWSPGFGMAVDRFGIPWMVNCEPARG
jgi:PhnB protein